MLRGISGLKTAMDFEHFEHPTPAAAQTPKFRAPEDVAKRMISSTHVAKRSEVIAEVENRPVSSLTSSYFRAQFEHFERPPAQPIWGPFRSLSTLRQLLQSNAQDKNKIREDLEGDLPKHGQLTHLGPPVAPLASYTYTGFELPIHRL